MLPRLVWVVFSLSPKGTPSQSPVCGVPHFRMMCNPVWLCGRTLPAPLPTLTWSWQAPLMHHDVATSTTDLRESTISTLMDNTPALAWQTKGSTTTVGPAAYLLQLQALHQRYHRYLPWLAHIPGSTNVMADDCSCHWDLSDQALLTHFNHTYPQTQHWQLCQLRPAWLSSVISALRRQQPALHSLQAPSPALPKLGPTGWTSATASTQIPNSVTHSTPSCSFRSSTLASAMDAPPKAVDLLGLTQYQLPLPLWVRRLPSWGPWTLVSPLPVN